MHALWHEWLQQPGIQLTDNQISHAPAHDLSTSVIPLTDACILSVSGPDASKFLQGQLTCDLAEVDRRGSLPGAHCNIKGHMHSLYQVIRADEACYWLRTRSSMAADALALLKKYIIFSKAEAVQAENLLGIGLTGPAARALAERIHSTTPGSALARHSDNLIECWFAADQLEQVMQLAGETAGLADSNTWELAAIDAAIPDLFPATREAFIPQMTNLQVFEGVSFTKGCYTGQEIVTRLQHRGQLKRPMYQAEVEAEAQPVPGMNLASGDKESVGQLVRVARCGDNRYRVLAVIIKDQAEHQTIHLANATGPALVLGSLPYVLDPRLFESKR
ncbi:folate-binding protein YgfZ [Marinobacterium maritimum]|uniref:Folate-binding protein YgfZ n=1 Tax=Marinobacterium maritimum TaxID=500162 RepID=A0ABP3TE88_9GAMM